MFLTMNHTTMMMRRRMTTGVNPVKMTGVEMT